MKNFIDINKEGSNLLGRLAEVLFAGLVMSWTCYGMKVCHLWSCEGQCKDIHARSWPSGSMFAQAKGGRHRRLEKVAGGHTGDIFVWGQGGGEWVSGHTKPWRGLGLAWIVQILIYLPASLALHQAAWICISDFTGADPGSSGGRVTSGLPRIRVKTDFAPSSMEVTF